MKSYQQMLIDTLSLYDYRKPHLLPKFALDEILLAAESFQGDVECAFDTSDYKSLDQTFFALQAMLLNSKEVPSHSDLMIRLTDHPARWDLVQFLHRTVNLILRGKFAGASKLI